MSGRTDHLANDVDDDDGNDDLKCFICMHSVCYARRSFIRFLKSKLYNICLEHRKCLIKT